MRKEAEQNAAEDEKRKAKVESENNADAIVYQSRKVLEEFKDKVDESTKSKIEAAIKVVEDARQSDEPEMINKKIEDLNKIMQEIGTKMYQDAAAQQPSEQSPEEETKGNNADDEKVVDAEFKEKKKGKA